MAVEHLYGRAIVFDYFPLAGDEDTTLHSLVSARLYGPNVEPTTEQLANTAPGHIAEVLTWTPINEEGTGPAGYRLTFSAVEDGTPDSREECDKFFVALNFRAEADGPVLQDDEQVIVYRPDGLTSKIRVTAQQVWGLESKLEQIGRSRLWTEEKIDIAIEELLNRLDGRGYAKRRLFNLHKLNLAARMLACSYCCVDLAGDGDESWEKKATFWRGQADTLFDIAKVGIDSKGDDKPEPEEHVQTGGSVAPLR